MSTSRARAFTLIEMLVVIGVIGVLLGILTPVLGSVRQSARRTACLANLRSIGLGLQVYLNENNAILPRALPLDDSEITGQQGEPLPDSILANLGPTVDSLEVFICPADEQIPPSLSDRPLGPVGIHCSYEYFAGRLMLFRELLAADPRPDVTATRFYEENPRFAVMGDSAERHPGGPQYDQNAVYMGDWHADWLEFALSASGEQQ